LRGQIWEYGGGSLMPLTGSLMPPGGPLIRTLTGHSNWINAVSVTQDGKYAVSASYDNTLKVWDIKTGREVAGFGCDSPSLCIVFSPDSTIIVAGERSGRVHFLLFRIETL
jgi:WD40 repeat protein